MKTKNEKPMQFAVRTIPALVAAVMAGGTTIAFAQTQGAALEEIVVTAQKQAERLQDVPMSIQAFSAQALENAAVNSFADVKSLAPSVEIKVYPNTSEDLLVQMRGIGSQSISIFTDVATPIHVDGIYIARASGLNMTVADLDSVEVLKGPQGTLYGRNAISGAINMKTARPTQDFGFTQNVTVGNYGRLISKTSVNIPLTETLAAKIAYIHDERDGFIKDSNGSGKHWGDRKANAARFDLRWKPTGNVTVDYSYDTAKTKYISAVTQCLNTRSSLDPYGPTAMAGTVEPGQCTTKRLSSLPMPNNAWFTMPPGSEVESSGHALTVEWGINDTTTFRSITGYRSLRDKHYWAVVNDNFTGMTDVNTNIPGNILDSGTFALVSPNGLHVPAKLHKTNDDYFSQEFVVIGKPSEALKYTAGLYYFEEKGRMTQDAGFSLYANLGGPLVGGLPAMELLAAVGAEDGRSKNTSTAVFGQFTWTPDILDRRLDITPGLRYTEDKREASVHVGPSSTYIVIPGSPNTILWTPPVPGSDRIASATGGPISGSNTFSKTTPSLTFQYHFNDDVQTYAKIVKGYRSGGFNQLASSSAKFSKGYGPETLTSMEVGLKGEFFDRRLRTNLAVFQMKYKDQQMSVAGPVLATYDIQNAGKSTFNGFELDATAAVTKALRLGLSWSHIEFKYDEITTQGVDVTQFYRILPSKNTYSATMDYAFGKVGPGRLNWHLDYAHVDKAYTNLMDPYAIVGGRAVMLNKADPTNQITPAYGIWNTRIAMSDIPVGPGKNGDLTVGLWVKNLTNKKYPAFNVDYGSYGVPYGSVSAWGDPRTYGLDVTYRY